MRGFVSLLLFCGIAAGVHLGFPIVFVADEMMAPGLRPDGWIIMYGVGLKPAPGLLVGFEDKGSRYVRRVVGMGGDKVAYNAGVLHINGRRIDQAEVTPADVEFLVPRADRSGADRKKAVARREGLAGVTYEVWLPRKSGRKRTRTGKGKEVAVPAGHLFVLCDNRAHCRDSRHFGTIPEAAVWAVR